MRSVTSTNQKTPISDFCLNVMFLYLYKLNTASFLGFHIFYSQKDERNKDLITGFLITKATLEQVFRYINV